MSTCRIIRFPINDDEIGGMQAALVAEYNMHPQHLRIGGLLLRHKKLPIVHSVSTDLRIIAMELVPVV